MPIEAAPGDAERLGQRLDPDGVRAAGGEGPQTFFDPAAARCAVGGATASVSRSVARVDRARADA